MKLKKNEVKQMNITQLQKNLEDLSKELIKLNTQRSTGATLENPGSIRRVRKTIARVLTELNDQTTNIEKHTREVKTNKK